MRYKSYLSLFLGAILLFLVVGCDSNVKCYEPDDFGSGHVNITSNPGSNMIHTVQPPGTTAKNYTPEYADWTNQGLVTNGQDILLVVRNNYQDSVPVGTCSTTFDPYHSWTAWFGSYQQAENEFFFSETCHPTSDWCAQSQPIAPGATIQPIPNGTTTSNPPCVYTKGAGAFALLVPKGTDPNNASPGGSLPQNMIAYHLASTCNGNQNSNIYDADCPAGGLYIPSGNIPSNCAENGCMLYTKIVDQLYEDNWGGYDVLVKSGFQLPQGYLTKLVIFVQGALCTATKQIFENLIPYLGYIRLLLVAYVAFSAIGFLIGTIEITQKELLVRIFKMAIVIQIATTTGSWSFFNDYFFKFFTNGIGEVVSMFMQEGTQAPPPPGTPHCVQNIGGFVLLDNILSKFSDITFYKVISVAFTSVSGFLFFFAFYIVVAIVAYACVMAVFTYLISYTIISILIVLAPIFIPFILFKATKSMFDNWLKNLLSNFIQPIVMLAFAFFIAQLVLNQTYFLLGIRVCWQIWSAVSFFGDVYRWWPTPVNDSNELTMVVPGRMCDTGSPGCTTPDKNGNMPPCTSNDCSGTYCADYACVGDRCPDAPYLDPKDSTDDAKLDALASGQYIDFGDVIMFALLGWFMWKFIQIIPTIAATLAGTPMNYVQSGALGQGVISNIVGAGNKSLGFIYTNAKRIYKARQAYKEAGKAGVNRKGVFGRLEAARAAAYSTEDSTLGGDIHKSWTAWKHKKQDQWGEANEARLKSGKEWAGNFAKKHNIPTSSTDVLKLVARGYVRAAASIADVTVMPLLGGIAGGAAAGADSIAKGIRGALARNKYTGERGGLAGFRAGTKSGAGVKEGALAGVKSGFGSANRAMTKYFGAHTFSLSSGHSFEEGEAKQSIRDALRSISSSTKYRPVEGSKKEKAKALAINAAKFINPFRSPLLSGMASSASNLFETKEQEKARKDRDYNWIHPLQDKIGGIVDNYMESKVARASHFLHGWTGGAYGTDIHKKQKDAAGWDRSRLDMIHAQHQINEESDVFSQKWAYDPTKHWRLTNTLFSVKADILANKKR